MATQVVFTALMGPHERITEQNVAKSSLIRFICFTDDPTLTSKTWEVVHVAPLFPNDSRRSQRHLKICGHKMLDEFDEWLYIDNTVKLLVDPRIILAEWLDGSDWTQFDHDAYDTTWKDFEVNRAKEADSLERLDEQLYDYSLNYSDALDRRPPWNGMFARRITPETRRHQELWFTHVLRYSSRDQLSSTVVAELSGLSVRRLQGSNRRSAWHSWPHRDGESAESKAVRVKRHRGFRSLADELNQERQEHLETRKALSRAQRELQSCQDRRWGGLVGLLRRVRLARKDARRRLRQATKRR